MNIELYDKILNGAKEYNKKISKNYGNSICSYPPTEPKFPLTIITEIRNEGIEGYQKRIQRCSNLGYQIDIFAKTKGNKPKSEIARSLAKDFDNYMKDIVGATQVSFNEDDNYSNGEMTRIILTYNTSLFENKDILY